MVLMVMFDGISNCLKLMFDGLNELVLELSNCYAKVLYFFSDFSKTTKCVSYSYLRL